jgi:Sigma-70 factor, region 1.1
MGRNATTLRYRPRAAVEFSLYVVTANENAMNQQNLKRLIHLGKERGYVTRDEIREAFPQIPAPPLHPQYADPNWRELRSTKMDDEQLLAITETFRDMGIEVSQ